MSHESPNIAFQRRTSPFGARLFFKRTLLLYAIIFKIATVFT